MKTSVRIISLLLAALGFGLTATTTNAQDRSQYTVTFFERTIDLEPYVQGFPYVGWDADFEAGTLTYFRRTPTGTFLMTQTLEVGLGSGLIDPTAGRLVHEIDWSTRNFWGTDFDAVSGDQIVLADERNDEVINLYRLSLEDGSLTKLTDVPYIYGHDFSKDGRTIGYIARYGDAAPYRNCLTLLDPQSGSSREVMCEEGSQYRMVWSSVNFRPDGSGIVLKVNEDGHRKQGTVGYIDVTRAEPEIEILLPGGVERFSHSSYDKPWLDNDRFYYVSDETGYENLYVYDLASRTFRQVTEVAEQAWFQPIEIDGRGLVLQVLDRPHENVMVVIDPETGDELGRRVFDANVGVIGFDEKNHFIISMTSVASPFMADEMWIELDGERAVWRLEPKIRIPDALARQIEQCEVERVEYPTFDIDPATGARRRLHAFLLTPTRRGASPSSPPSMAAPIRSARSSRSTATPGSPGCLRPCGEALGLARSLWP